MTTATQEQMDHFQSEVQKIQAVLNDLSLSHDTRLVATILMNHAAQQLQALCSAGIYDSQTIIDMISLAFAHVTEPLPTERTPKTVMFSRSDSIN